MNRATLHNEIIQAATLLAQGKLVAFPTETVYGLGADARNEEAVARVFKAKGRPSNNPLIVHVATISDIERYSEISRCWNPTLVRTHLEKLSTLWPGPLSVILPRSKEIASTVCAGGDSVAIRIPQHPIALKLLEVFGGPVAAPSANQSMYVSPTTAQHVRDSLHDKVDLIIDGGPCNVGIESTVLSLMEPTPRILRPGAITVDILSKTLGCNVLGPNNLNVGDTEVSLSPGMLAQHYSPHTPVRLKTSLVAEEILPPRVGALIFSSWRPDFPVFHSKVISPSGNLEEVAAHLFGALRELDTAHLDLIVVDTCEPIGLGEAIMDRLIRASRR